MCSKVRIASRRTACMATLANIPSRIWVNAAIRMRVPPYPAVISNGAAITHAIQELPVASCSWARPSVANLKVNGTAMVASLAATSSTSDHSTRRCRSGRSDGQI